MIRLSGQRNKESVRMSGYSNKARRAENRARFYGWLWGNGLAIVSAS